MVRRWYDKISLMFSILLLIGLIVFHLILAITTHDEDLMILVIITDPLLGLVNGILLVYVSFSNPGYLPKFITGNTIAE